MNEDIKLKKCSKCGEEFPATNEYFHNDKSRVDDLCYVCKKCKSPAKKYNNIPEGHKKCRQCKNVLPLDKFNTNKRSFDGIMNICVECQLNNRGKEHNDKDKICKKCGRTLPLNEEYYQKDKLCLDGFRNICKECKGEKFGIPRKSQKWTKEDSDILIKHYPFMSNEDLVTTYFPTRTYYQISNYATKVLKLHKNEEYLKYRAWSKEQLDILINNYSFTDIDDLVVLIGKNKGLIIDKASKLKLVKNSWWTKEEEQILIDNYSNMKNEDLVNLYFLNRGFNSVMTKVYNLGLSKDKDYLYQVRVKTGTNNLKMIPDQNKENNPRWVERTIIKCDQCGKDIELTPINTQNQENYFCSRECMGKWRSINLSGENSPIFGRADEIWTPEMRLKAAENAVIRLKKLNFSKKPTKPQLIINNLLNDLNINFEDEYDCKYYLIDNYLTNYNLMIEVQGNFFHCSPVMNLENSRKTKIIGKDKAKHTYIKKYKNIEILYLWEKDILEDLEKCKSLIMKYINNNGKLENYHSYNYYLNNNELKLIDNLYVIGY